jgi:hypothetical protein
MWPADPARPVAGRSSQRHRTWTHARSGGVEDVRPRMARMRPCRGTGRAMARSHPVLIRVVRRELSCPRTNEPRPILTAGWRRLAPGTRHRTNCRPPRTLYDAAGSREWRNGRRSRLKIDRREAWGFESPLSHQSCGVTASPAESRLQRASAARSRKFSAIRSVIRVGSPRHRAFETFTAIPPDTDSGSLVGPAPRPFRRSSEPRPDGLRASAGGSPPVVRGGHSPSRWRTPTSPGSRPGIDREASRPRRRNACLRRCPVSAETVARSRSHRGSVMHDAATVAGPAAAIIPASIGQPGAVRP